MTAGMEAAEFPCSNIWNRSSRRRKEHRRHGIWRLTLSVCSMYYYVPCVGLPRVSALTIPSHIGIRHIAGNRIHSLPFSVATRQNNLLLLSSSELSFSTSNDSEQEKIATQRRARDMEPLATWALDWGVILADGIQLTERSVGDWTLSLTEPFKQGSPLLTVPSHIILSSDIQDDTYLPYYDDNEMRNVYTWMSVEWEMSSRPFNRTTYQSSC